MRRLSQFADARGTTTDCLLMAAMGLAVFLLMGGYARAIDPPIANSAELRIINDSWFQTICYVFISPNISFEDAQPSSDERISSAWGKDWLGEHETIRPGEDYAFDLAQGIDAEESDYGVLLVDCDGQKLQMVLEIPLDQPFELRFDDGDPCERFKYSTQTLFFDTKYVEALQSAQAALNCYRWQDDRGGEGVSLGMLGNIYAIIEQPEEALGYYQQALVIAQESGNLEVQASFLNSIGATYEALQDDEKSLDYTQQALTIAREIDHPDMEMMCLNNLGAYYVKLGEYEEALDYFQQTLAIARRTDNRHSEGTSLQNIGTIYSRLGQYEESLDYAEQALEIIQETGDRPAEGGYLYNIGSTYEYLGQYEDALSYYQQALHLIETMREGVALDEFKTEFVTRYAFVYDRIISLLVRLEHPRMLFDYIQRAKARTFLDQMGNMPVPPPTSISVQLVREEEDLRGEIWALNDSLREEWGKPLDERSQDVIQTLSIGLEQKREAYARLLPRLKLENPEYASMVAVQTATLTETQEVLAGTTLLEYYVLPEQTLAFVVTADSFHVEPISVTQEMLGDEIDRFELESQPPLQGIPASLQNLYGWLIAPIEPYLTTPRLIVAPHDLLHYVPFAALHDGNRYLIERHVLGVLPSASILPFILEKRKASLGPPLVLGDADGSLPFSRQEAQAIAEREGTTAYVGKEAQERLLWTQGPDAGILHLSTHGVYDPISPLFSHLVLAPDAEGEYDGLLEVHEVYNLDLHNAGLVVLSACQTNLGEQSAGDEIISLNRAFVYAGTPSVLSTLWSVEDEATKNLMLAFYAYLDQGYTKGEALRQAQVDLLRTPETAHPYFWAGFVLTGDMGDGELHGDEGELAVGRDAEATESAGETDQTEPSKGGRELVASNGAEAETPEPAGETDQTEPVKAGGLDWHWIVGAGVGLVVVGIGVWIWKRRTGLRTNGRHLWS